jgi:uncharacterized protein with FMN-binding domain
VRRAVLAVLTTAAGTTLLVGAKAGLFTGAAAPTSVTAPADPELDDGGTPSAAGGASPGAGTLPTPTRGPKPPAGGPTTPTPPAAPAGLKAGTYTGSVIQTRWGPVQVRIVVSSAKLTDVTAVQTPSSHSRSVQINSRATPILRQEALVAQSAKIDTVSGASVTSDGYRRSLQSALDMARRG